MKSLCWGVAVAGWLSYESKKVKISTFYKYRLFAKKYLLLIPSRFLVSSISFQYLDSFFSKLSGSVALKNRVLCYVGKVFDFCSLFYDVSNFAYRKVVLLKDYSIRLPKEDYVLSVADFTKFYSCVPDGFWKVYFLLEFVCGFRINEIRGLRVCDLKLSDSLLVLDHQCTSKLGVGKAVLISPKTSSSCRVYVLPSFLVERLNGFVLSNGLSGSDFLFAGRSKEVPIGDTAVYSVLHSVQAKAGLPRFVFHSFRKSEASYLNEIGISDDDIKNWLGHSSYEITKKYYIRNTDERKRAIANALDSKLSFLK